MVLFALGRKIYEVKNINNISDLLFPLLSIAKYARLDIIPFFFGKTQHSMNFDHSCNRVGVVERSHYLKTFYIL